MQSWEQIEEKASCVLRVVRVTSDKAIDKQTVDAENLVQLELIIRTEVNPRLVEVAQFMHEYDLDTNTFGNGYRSVVGITLKYLRKTEKVMQNVATSKYRLKFHTPSRLLPVINKLLTCQSELLEMAIICHGCSGKEKRLIIADYPLEMLRRLRSMDKKPYYGSMKAVQFDGSLRSVFEFMLGFTASYSASRQLFNKTIPVLTSLSTMMTVPVYAIDSELRAAQCVKQFESHNISFLQDFWDITESYILNSGIQLPAPIVGTSRRVYVSCRPTTLKYKMPVANTIEDVTRENERVGENSTIQQERGTTGHDTVEIEIEIPTPNKTKIPVRIVRVAAPGSKFASRFLNKLKSRFGKVPIVWSEGLQPPSECKEVEHDSTIEGDDNDCGGILFHIHGGGFVAQTSRSHQVYLKKWARELNVMIVSVDYSLSPQNPFPIALTECCYAYAWIVQHTEQMGYPGNNICLSGDSAGGNLVVALGLKIIKEGLPPPFAIQANYPALCIRLLPSPSRLLSVGDILLPLGVLEDCLNAYVPGRELGSRTGDGDPFGPIDYFMSPWHAPDDVLKQLPPVYIVAGAYDPLLDDAVDFARKLRAIGNEVNLTVVDKCAHGFLQFVDIGGKRAKLAQHKALEDLKEMYKRSTQSSANGLRPVVRQRKYTLGWVEVKQSEESEAEESSY
eukprot:CFRG0237T1